MRRRRLLAAGGSFFAAACASGRGSTPATSVPRASAADAVLTSDSSAASFSELKGMAAGVPAVTSQEFTSRVQRVQRQMLADDVAAVVSEPGANMRYLSGVRWGRSERPFLAIVLSEGLPVFVAPAFERRKAEEQLPDHEIVTWEEHDDPFAKVCDVIGDRTGAVDVDPDARGFIQAGLAERLPKATTRGSIVGDLRLHKTSTEVERLRRANAITKAALASVRPLLVPGIRQSEAAALVTEAQTTAGLDHVWALVLFGPAAAFPHGTKQDRVLGANDVVLIDTGGMLHGYASDVSRTWSVGEPSEALRRAWQTVAAAQAAALAVMAPSVACGKVDAAARDVISEAGYGSDYTSFTHRLGHGIGLQVHEPPYLVPRSEVALATGMTMSNEPGIYLPDEFGVRIEDIVVITEGGAEVLGPKVGSFDDPLAGHSRVDQFGKRSNAGQPVPNGSGPQSEAPKKPVPKGAGTERAAPNPSTPEQPEPSQPVPG